MQSRYFLGCHLRYSKAFRFKAAVNLVLTLPIDSKNLEVISSITMSDGLPIILLFFSNLMRIPNIDAIVRYESKGLPTKAATAIALAASLDGPTRNKKLSDRPQGQRGQQGANVYALFTDFETPARMFERVKLCLAPSLADLIKRACLWTIVANSSAENGPRSSSGQAFIISSISATRSLKAKGLGGMNCMKKL